MCAAIAIAAAGGAKKRKIDFMDELRPHSGIKYNLSQTQMDFDAGYTKILGELTIVEYDPGQDLTSLLPPKISYAKKRSRKPVWVFLEERIAQKRAFQANELEKIAREKRKRRVVALKWLTHYMKSRQYM